MLYIVRGKIERGTIKLDKLLSSMEDGLMEDGLVEDGRENGREDGEDDGADFSALYDEPLDDWTDVLEVVEVFNDDDIQIMIRMFTA